MDKSELMTLAITAAALDNLSLSNWQLDKKLSAEAAVDAVLDAVRKNLPLDGNFIEQACDAIHAKCLGQDSNCATEVEKFPYTQLPEQEKGKYRFFVREAVAGHQYLASMCPRCWMNKAARPWSDLCVACTVTERTNKWYARTERI